MERGIPPNDVLTSIYMLCRQHPGEKKKSSVVLACFADEVVFWENNRGLSKVLGFFNGTLKLLIKMQTGLFHLEDPSLPRLP